jgi:hypothetical protein
VSLSTNSIAGLSMIINIFFLTIFKISSVNTPGISIFPVLNIFVDLFEDVAVINAYNNHEAVIERVFNTEIV